MTLPAGKRDAYLTLLRESATTFDAAGGLAATYTKVDDFWGCVVPKQASEKWQAYHQEAGISHVVTIPWTTGLKATDRFTETLHGRTYVYEVAGPPAPASHENNRHFGFETVVPVYQLSDST